MVKSDPKRYVFIDALRGIAALAVLWHHLLHNTVLEITLRQILPSWTQVISHYGALGVQVFFVISGFVIAHSLRNTSITKRSVVNFILRRQLRLDPPYWAALFLALAFATIQSKLPGLVRTPLPSPKTIALNLSYLQNITNTAQVVGVAWTLCLEIQFYLVFIAVLIAGRLLTFDTDRVLCRSSVLIVFATGSLSLLEADRQHTFGAWFFPYWMYFAGGSLCCWSLSGQITKWTFGIFVACFIVAVIRLKLPALNAGLVTILTIFCVGKLDRLTTWLGNCICQYFGRISYSLYLVHLPVLSAVMRGGYKLTYTNTYAALCWMLLAAVCSIVTAQLLYMSVEKPSMRFASKLKGRLSFAHPFRRRSSVAEFNDSVVANAAVIGPASK